MTEHPFAALAAAVPIVVFAVVFWGTFYVGARLFRLKEGSGREINVLIVAFVVAGIVTGLLVRFVLSC